jgi:hypothetical protein
MDEIQKVLVKVGRKDLAQKYYKKISVEKTKELDIEMKNLVKDHLAKGIPIRQNMFKIGTDTFSNFINTAREMLKNNEIEVDAEDKYILEKMATGQKGIYEGKTVTLESPTRISNGKKKFRVYVNSGKKDKDGNIKAKKIEWGAPGVQIKNDNDVARKSFLARHECSTKTDKTTPGWWACNVHLFAKQLGLKSTKPW